MDKERGALVVVSAPSGTGKSTILRLLQRRREKLCFSISATTRQPRGAERDGVEYYFVSREEFDRMAAEDAFLEHAEYVGNCYGTPKAPVDEKLSQGWDVYLDIDVQGALQVLAQRPDTLAIFVMPPSLEELERRLRGRQEDAEEVIRERLDQARREMAQRDKFRFVVVNDDAERAAEEISGLIDAYKLQMRTV